MKHSNFRRLTSDAQDGAGLLTRAGRPRPALGFLHLRWGNFWWDRRFRLPKRLAGAAQNPVGASGRRSFQPLHENAYWHARQDQQMHMVWHNHPSLQFIKASLHRSHQNGFCHQICEASMFEPPRPVAGSVENAILSHEGAAVAGICNTILSGRQRTPQTPSEKQVCILGMKMRQSPAVFRHGIAWQAKPPAPPNWCHHRNNLFNKNVEAPGAGTSPGTAAMSCRAT